MEILIFHSDWIYLVREAKENAAKEEEEKLDENSPPTESDKSEKGKVNLLNTAIINKTRNFR